MGARRTSRGRPARKPGSRSSARSRLRRPSGAATPSSSCCSSNARRAERLARIALLRRANSAARNSPAGSATRRSRLPSDRSLAGGTPRPPSSGRHRASDRSGTWPPPRSSSSLALLLLPPSATARTLDTRLLTGSSERIALVVATWNVSLDNLWREAARRGIGLDAAWVLCTNGRELRLVDTQRTYSRAYLQFDLQQSGRASANVRCAVGRPARGGVSARPWRVSLVLEILRSSARHGQAVSRSLRIGVIESVQHLLGGLNKCGNTRPLAAVRRVAYRRIPRPLPDVCRVAQPGAQLASGLPRELHRRIAARTRGASRQGAGSVGGAAGDRAARAQRLSRRKPCRAAVQRPAVFPDAIADRRIVRRRRRSGAAGAAALSTTRPADQGTARQRTRIDYRDLGVEQLGAVYESVLDYEPAYADSSRGQILLRRGGDARKSTGSFYTPQTLTDYVVRRTLHPLVDGATADRILQLRVVDPAMGSAAFLVSACRYLARAYERALVREGLADDADIDEVGARAVQAAHRAAMPLRCRPESDGGAARAPVALARYTVGQQTADLSRSSPCLRQQPHRRVAHRHCETAAGGATAAAPESDRPAPLLRRRPRAFARASRRRAPLAGRHSG